MYEIASVFFPDTISKVKNYTGINAITSLIDMYSFVDKRTTLFTCNSNV